MSDSQDDQATSSGSKGSLILVAAIALLVLGWWIFERPAPREWDGQNASFVKNEACIECHKEQHHHWQGSHHDLAMDIATPETVLGDFADVTFDHFGELTRFYRKGDRYFVNTSDAAGTLKEHEVKYTFGVTPLQQYLIQADGGRLQCLQVSWDTENKRWYHIQEEPINPGDPLHWTGMQFQANFMCIECHVTNMERGYDPETNSYNSTWSDIDVGCQACHGPGSEHVDWAATHKKPKSSEDAMGLAVRFRGAPADVQIEHCARCHARRTVVSEPYRYGAPFLEHYTPRLLVEPLYHPDGQILDEVYVYGSFLQAKKHKRGVRCSDCHDPHSARLLAEGNDLCVRCHQKDAPKEFPTIRKINYDTPEHHFHTAGKPGSQCVDCHMAAKTYMGVDPRRDHSFRIPRPDLSVAIGTPNACNGCHDDKTAAWAAAEVAKRFPDSAKRRHYGPVFAAARAGMPLALQPLEALALDPERPSIVRATAVHYLGRYPLQKAAPTVAMLLGDDDPLIRATAVESFNRLFPRRVRPEMLSRKAQMLAPLLTDKSKLVRTEVARALANVPPAGLPEEHKAAFEAALREFVERQDAVKDRPGSHLNLAVLAEDRRDPLSAEKAYMRAIVLDPLFYPARFNLAQLLNGQQRHEEAEKVLRELVDLSPQNGEGWYSLGLLLNERKKEREAIEALSTASRLMPRRARVRYNLALALDQAGQREAAGAMLQEARKLTPQDPDILAALIMHHIAAGSYAQAEALIAQLERISPRGSRVPADMRARLKAAKGD